MSPSRVAFWVAPIVVALLSVACVRAVPVSTLQRGDTRTSVIQRMGEPGDRQFSGDSEALQYCRKTGSALLGNESGEYTVVWLRAGIVTGVTTYRAALLPLKPCESAFRTIRWEEAPDRGQTVRSR